MTPLDRVEIARRVAREIPDGSFVNLGIGLPTLVANYIPDGREVLLHSENGILNVGPAPAEGDEDWDLVNAGKQAVSLLPGGSYFDSALSFMMMRGGHLDYSILGAYQVSGRGDLANWSMDDNSGLPGVGGAMDLAVGARAIWAVMEHTTKSGAPRIVNACSLPLTAPRVVTRIFTNLAMIDVSPEGLRVREIIPGLDLAGLQSLTDAQLTAAADLKSLTA